MPYADLEAKIISDLTEVAKACLTSSQLLFFDLVVVRGMAIAEAARMARRSFSAAQKSLMGNQITFPDGKTNGGSIKKLRRAVDDSLLLRPAYLQLVAAAKEENVKIPRMIHVICCQTCQY